MCGGRTKGSGERDDNHVIGEAIANIYGDNKGGPALDVTRMPRKSDQVYFTAPRIWPWRSRRSGHGPGLFPAPFRRPSGDLGPLPVFFALGLRERTVIGLCLTLQFFLSGVPEPPTKGLLDQTATGSGLRRIKKGIELSNKVRVEGDGDFRLGRPGCGLASCRAMSFGDHP